MINLHSISQESFGDAVGCHEPEETLAKGRRAARAAQRYTYDRAIASYRQIIGDIMHTVG
jgi:hypothetical protein